MNLADIIVVVVFFILIVSACLAYLRKKEKEEITMDVFFVGHGDISSTVKLRALPVGAFFLFDDNLYQLTQRHEHEDDHSHANDLSQEPNKQVTLDPDTEVKPVALSITIQK